MKLDAAFIPLPFRFDTERMAYELEQFANIPWRAHPDKTNGNSALPLISGAGGDNDDTAGDMKPTPYLEKCPYLQQVLASFNEVFGRSRFMRIEAGSTVVPHIDVHHHWYYHVRIHIPIVTNPAVIFYCGDSQIHMGAGECWIFDTWRPHRVINGGSQARTHLVIDTTGSSRFWDMVARADRAMRANMPLPAEYIPYIPGRPVQVVTERYGLHPVMPPGEVDSLTHDLIADLEAGLDTDPVQATLYKRVLLGFCKDWRALWHRFAIHEAGWPHYRELLETTYEALPEFKPPLRIKGTTCPVKTAILERVLKAALAPDLYRDFITPANAEPVVTESSNLMPIPETASGSQQNLIPERPTLAQLGERGRNARCHCGSGLRYKHCHGAATSSVG